MASSEAWFFHTHMWRQYCVAYRSGAIDRSFAVEHDGQLVAICPLIQEDDQFTMGGEPGLAPLQIWGGGIYQMLFEELDRLQAKHQIRRIAFRCIPPLEEIDYVQAGYRDISWSTRILDLTQSEADLWHDIRKGHKADIRKAERRYMIVADGRENGGGLIDVYRYVHERAHPGARSARTYQYQWQWWRQGFAMAAVATDESVIGAAYFLLYKDVAYYASSASLIPDIMAAILWRAMLALKARGIKTLELGWQGKATDEKGKQVEHFKRGMGGIDVPIYAVERRDS